MVMPLDPGPPRNVPLPHDRDPALLDGIPGVLWAAYGRPDDPQQRIVYVSPNVETMLGYSVQEWLSTPNFWLSIVHPEDRVSASARAAAAFERGEAHVNRFRWLRKDGRALSVEARATVMRDDAGVPVGMRGVTLDVSSRTGADDAFQQNIEDLSRMQQVSTRLMHAGDFNGLLHDILTATIDITGADMGNIQLFE